MLKRAPTDPASQLQWLVDRAEISDLLYSFARAIDEKNQSDYADTFTEDGAVELPHGTTRGREAIRVMRGPPPHWGTQHISTNHMIEFDGDVANARIYLQAAHVFDRTDTTKNARAGGWYNVALRRTQEGWRLSHVKLDIVWTTGVMMPPRPAGPQAETDGFLPPPA